MLFIKEESFKTQKNIQIQTQSVIRMLLVSPG